MFAVLLVAAVPAWVAEVAEHMDTVAAVVTDSFGRSVAVVEHGKGVVTRIQTVALERRGADAALAV